MTGDTVSLSNSGVEGLPLLEHVMKEGRRPGSSPSFAAIASHTKDQIRTLPANLRGLGSTESYPVDIDPGVLRLREAAQALIDARRKL